MFIKFNSQWFLSDFKVYHSFPQFCAPLIADSNDPGERRIYLLSLFPRLAHLLLLPALNSCLSLIFYSSRVGDNRRKKWGGEKKFLFNNRYDHYRAFMFFGFGDCLPLTPSLLRLAFVKSSSGTIQLQLLQVGSACSLARHLRT